MTNPMNIIVIEDHDALREVTVDVLRSEGHHVIGVDSAEALGEEWGFFLVDLLVLDLNLPGEDGISLARRLRQVQPDIGIIMVTARTQLSEKMAGYEGGADIYLTKPTSLDELNAAVAALGRRLKHLPFSDDRVQLDLHQMTVKGSKGTVSMTATDAALLAGLARANTYRLESWQLIELLNKDINKYNKTSLEVCIVRLRKKLLAAGTSNPAIKAVRDYGYQLCIHVEIS